MSSHFTHWDKESLYDSIRELAFAFQKSRILLTAMELDIFSVIGDASKTAEQVASEIKSDVKAVGKLLNALCGLELINKNDTKYSVLPETHKYLVKGSKEYMEDLKFYSNLWDTWSNLTEVIRTGKPFQFNALYEKSDEWIQDYFNSFHYKTKQEADEIIKNLKFKNVYNLLELGCGSAQLTIEILKANPHIKAHVSDLPVMTKLTKENILKEEMTDRIEISSGDFFQEPIGKNYDMIILSNVIHEYSVFENINLMHKCYEALNKQGQVVIIEKIIDDDRTKPANSVFYSLNMLLNTKTGDTYSETDLWIMLKEAWFKNVIRIDTEFDTSIMIGIK